MKKTVTIIIFFLSLTSISQELTVPEIQMEVEKIDSGLNLSYHSFDTDAIYDQTTEGGGTFEIWVGKKEIRKITQSVFLSTGKFTTTVYLKNRQPIFISEKEEHYPWKDDNSGYDYEKAMELNYSEYIYAHSWKKDPIEVTSEGESLRNETFCGMSDYLGLMETAENILP